MNAMKTAYVVRDPPSQPWDLNREILASDLGQASKILLLVIVDHAGHGRSKCTASTDTLAREAGMTGRYVRNCFPPWKRPAGSRSSVQQAPGSPDIRFFLLRDPESGAITRSTWPRTGGNNAG